MARLAEAPLAGSELPGTPPRTPAGALGRASLLLLGLIATGVILRFAGPDILHVAPTPRGAAVMVAAGALLTAAGLPRQAVAFAAGYAFGAPIGIAVSLPAQLLGCIADYLWARAVARRWAERRLGVTWRRLHVFLAGRPFIATLTLRLLPLGNNLALNLFAGAAALRFTPFLLATLLGYLPQTVIFALAGSGVQLGRGLQLGLAGGMFVASAALGLWLMRRQRG